MCVYTQYICVPAFYLLFLSYRNKVLTLLKYNQNGGALPCIHSETELVSPRLLRP